MFLLNCILVVYARKIHNFLMIVNILSIFSYILIKVSQNEWKQRPFNR